MGGGGGSAPAPKTFTPPPLQDGPAANPIPNFFAAQRPQSPYQAFAAQDPMQRPNPFQQGSAQPPGMGGPHEVGANILELLKLLQQGRK